MESNGAYLRRAREKAGLTQRALCDKTGVSYSSITKMEQHVIDVARAPAITVYRLAFVLNVTVGQLIGLEPR